MPVTPWKLREAASLLHGGSVVAYPTEGVFGLGCDPWRADAVARILALKGRDRAKGLILIASGWADLAGLIAPLEPGLRERVARTWPGPVTWIMPAASRIPGWLTGGRPTVAVRVTAHPVASALCRAFGGALVSTSANRSGRPPARDALGVRLRLGDAVDLILSAPTGGQPGPTEIRDARDGRVLRPARGREA